MKFVLFTKTFFDFGSTYLAAVAAFILLDRTSTKCKHEEYDFSLFVVNIHYQKNGVAGIPSHPSGK